MSNEIISKDVFIKGDYIALLVTFLFVIGIASIEIGLVFHARFALYFMNFFSIPKAAMWIGLLPWVVVAIFLWGQVIKDHKNTIKHNPFYCIFAVIITGVVFGSFMGIFDPKCTNFALYANALIWVGMAILFLSTIIQECRKKEGVFSTTSEENNNKIYN